MQCNTRICGRPVQEQVLLRRLIWSQTCLRSGVPIWCHEDLNNNIQYFWTETYLLTIRFIHRKTNELFPYKKKIIKLREKIGQRRFHSFNRPNQCQSPGIFKGLGHTIFGNSSTYHTIARIDCRTQSTWCQNNNQKFQYIHLLSCITCIPIPLFTFVTQL